MRRMEAAFHLPPDAVSRHASSSLACHGTLVITPSSREQPGVPRYADYHPIPKGAAWRAAVRATYSTAEASACTAYVQCVEPRGQAALRLRYV